MDQKISEDIPTAIYVTQEHLAQMMDQEHAPHAMRENSLLLDNPCAQIAIKINFHIKNQQNVTIVVAVWFHHLPHPLVYGSKAPHVFIIQPLKQEKEPLIGKIYRNFIH